MKRFLLALLLAAAMAPFGGAAVLKQDGSAVVIRGRITDKTDGSPAAFATVALVRRDSTIAAAGTADMEGAWSLKAPAGSYVLAVSLIGYKDYRSEVILGGGSEEKDIALEEDKEMLAAARVSEKVPLVEMKPDKIVMNVRESAFAQGSSAMDLMRKAPGVTIDKDGNVKLNGQAVDVWIDGRPSYLSGEALKGMLSGTSGETIDKIELIANPSARYDASGQGGIINIKTRKNGAAGLNGTAGIEGGGFRFQEEGLWSRYGEMNANIAFRTAKTNTSLGLSGGIDDSPFRISVDTDTELPSGKFSSNTSTLSMMNMQYRDLKLSHDWFIDGKNIVGAIVSAPAYNSTMPTLEGSGESFLNGVSLGKTISESESIYRGPRYSANLNYTHTFDEAKASEITANIDWYRNISENVYDEKTLDGSRTLLSETGMDSRNRVDIWSAKADWQGLVFGKVMAEAGGKWAFSRTGNNMNLTRTGEPDTDNSFIYDENIGALYVSASSSIGQAVSWKAGLRGEFTSSLGDWNEKPRNWFDLFPSLSLSWAKPGKVMAALSYSRRISRPRYSQLDPTPNFIDSRNYTAGNKDLLPEYTDALSLTAGFGQHFSLSAAWNHTTNLHAQVPSFLADGTEILTWSNYGHRNLSYISANISYLPLTKWLSWTLSASGMLIDTRPAFNGYTCLSFVLPKDWKVEWDGFMSAGIVWGLFEIGPMGSSSVAVKKSVMDGKLTFNFKMDDIFNTMRQTIRINSEAGTTLMVQDIFMRKAVLGVSWNFGKAQQSRRRNVGNLEEAARAGKSGSIGK